ncbi:MAG: N-acetyltransferase [Rhodospirillaceae bacterium]|nr:N-acetyltransferase [Rhodospirillaceae bacterium]
MADGGAPAVLKVASELDAVHPGDWDACVAGACAGNDNPFLSHAFLSALEHSKSATADTGWLPQHLLVEDDHGRLLGAAPMYLKSHSYGEYVFDHAWADAYERAGGRYYPKLQMAVPFTPVPGPRLLARAGADRDLVVAALIHGAAEVAAQNRIATVHATFPHAADAHRLEEAGWLLRTGQQYHWVNDGYGSFDDFLAALASRKRKAIKKERRAVVDAGITMRVLTGDELKPHHWDAFFGFYTSTSDRKWGVPYLTRAFFDEIGRTLADRIALVVAEDDGRLVAGALNLIGGATLYGRNWGCYGHYKFLHFEACYYQAIEFAIARGLKTVEAGAQGQHKIQRGYLPTKTYSAHLIRDPNFRSAVADFLERETDQVDWQIEALSTHSPFRRTDTDPARAPWCGEEE